jgi:hypothetical protein
MNDLDRRMRKLWAVAFVIIALAVFFGVNTAHAAIYFFHADGTYSTTPGGSPSQMTQFVHGKYASQADFNAARTFNTTTGAFGTGSGSGAVVAESSVARTVGVGAAEGASVATRVATTVKTAFTAGGLAEVAVGAARKGLPWFAASVALGLALDEAHLAWDSLNKQMVYNPSPVATTHPAPAGYAWKWGNDTARYSSAEAAAQANNVRAGNNGVRVGSVGTCRGNSPFLSCDDKFYYTPGNEYLGNCTAAAKCTVIDLYQIVATSGAPAGPPSQYTCPNGVSFNDTTQCKQGLPDDQAWPKLTPYINPSNGPTIAQDAHNGGQDLPTIAAPPVVVMPPTVTSDPKITTNPDGSSERTTTTVTNTCTNGSCNSVVQNTTNYYNPSGTQTGTKTEVVPSTQQPAVPEQPDFSGHATIPGSYPVKEDFYKKDTKTFGDTLTTFKNTASSSPIMSAATGFFTITASGSCPTWSATYSLFGVSQTLVFDFLCAAWFVAFLPWLKATLLLLAGYRAFWIAVIW